jgi:hypothetical protein
MTSLHSAAFYGAEKVAAADLSALECKFESRELRVLGMCATQGRPGCHRSNCGEREDAER